MNAIVAQQIGQVSRVFAGSTAADSLSAGVQASFGLIGCRGKVWSIKYRGDERAIMRPDNDGPMNSIEVVILAASQHISKIWYEHDYVEGSNAAPDCYSTNGISPEPNVAKRQNPVCATCPRNAWGSRITPAGKQGKDCADSKRLAIVPLTDIPNEVFGGPMLLRVPPASLQDLATYGDKMQAMGYPYFAIGTRISFDTQSPYPKFLFNAIRALNDQEAELVVKLRESPAVKRILAEASEHQPVVDNQTAIQQAFEQPPTQGASLNGTGAASTASAQTAAQTGAVQPGEAPATQTQVAQASSTPPKENAGGAQPAASTQTTGFGGAITPASASGSSAGTKAETKSKAEPKVAQMATGFGAVAPLSEEKATAQPATNGQAQAAPTIEEESVSAETASPSSFEDELDAKLAGLLQ